MLNEIKKRIVQNQNLVLKYESYISQKLFREKIIKPTGTVSETYRSTENQSK